MNIFFPKIFCVSIKVLLSKVLKGMIMQKCINKKSKLKFNPRFALIGFEHLALSDSLATNSLALYINFQKIIYMKKIFDSH